MRKIEDVEALIQAALEADKAGDYEHARGLRERALKARRLLREQQAGLVSPWEGGDHR